MLLVNICNTELDFIYKKFQEVYKKTWNIIWIFKKAKNNIFSFITYIIYPILFIKNNTKSLDSLFIINWK